MYGLTRAPEINRPELQWFNVERPLDLGDLRGRLVVLDFWTFCCINCLHVVPTLGRVEAQFPDEVVVIGVHSPKFSAEQCPHNLRHAIARCGVRHPVIHDPNMVLWDEYCVQAWPTLVFVGPDGYIYGELTGEPEPERLLAGVGAMINEWRSEGRIDPAPLPLRPIEEAGGNLRFPGKIKPVPAVMGGPKRWAVADSGHHQIVLFDDDGREMRRFGSGLPGFLDSDSSTTRFRGPQGLICAANAIYVADTGNHAIRRIDLQNGATTTLAGTGARGRALEVRPIRATEVALASVWDLELIGRRLFFANAGSHQIGELDLDTLNVRAAAGSSAEDILDGPATEAQLAQPSGLARDEDGRILYFADSESSSVRRLCLEESPRVDTLVGTGLFDFGDVDGCFCDARLQHPLGLTCCDRQVVVADSFNGKLRFLDLDHGSIRELDEDGFDSVEEDCLPVGEPAGVAADGAGRLLVSDTNNHRVVEVRMAEKVLRTWTR